MNAKYSHLNIGVLALQGDFERHQHALFDIGADVTLVRLPVDLEKVDALIIPGGESTTMDKLIDTFELREPLIEFGRSKPVWGTCAGMIMLAKKIEDNLSGVTPFGLMDIDVVRNGYGRQVFSFEENVNARLRGVETPLRVSFIRAPIIRRIGEQVKTLAVFQNVPVLVEENRIMASSFHTELHEDTRLLEYFLQKFCLD
jgi:5'-phosphate synthase pdxT subunit